MGLTLLVNDLRLTAPKSQTKVESAHCFGCHAQNERLSEEKQEF